ICLSEDLLTSGNPQSVEFKGNDKYFLFADSRGAMHTATANFHDIAYMRGAIARWLNLEGVTFAAEAFSSQHPLVQATVTRLAKREARYVSLATKYIFESIQL